MQIQAASSGLLPPTDSLKRDGFNLHRKVLDQDTLSDLSKGLDALTAGTASYGMRNLRRRLPALDAILDSAVLKSLATRYLGTRARPVRSILFDKTLAHNWAVPWHQDRSVAVANRANVAGFERWSIKDDVHHVEPPAEMLERMVTFRIHLDAASTDTGALMVLPGTHVHGRLNQNVVAALVRECKPETCSAEAGDVLAMRPLLLHASKRATKSGRRRVIHVEYCMEELPLPLAWAE